MKKYMMLTAGALFALSLAACSADKVAEPSTTKAETTQAAEATQTIAYLGETYELTADVQRIVAGSYEVLEDMVAMDIEPAGVFDITDAPDYLQHVKAASIGDIIAPSAEATMLIEPDVILGTKRWQPETIEQLEKVQTIIPYSQEPMDWEDNLKLLGQLTNNETTAQSLIDDYHTKVKQVPVSIKEKLANESALLIRYRKSLYIYPEDVYFNPVLYQDLGMTAPTVVKATTQQAELSFEALAQLNPSILLLQIPAADSEKVVADLKNDPVFKNLDAVKNDRFYVNLIDPAAIGGTVLSKNLFLDAFLEKVAN